MDDKQLLAAIEQYEGNAETSGGIQDDRVEALDYYFGEPLGNEVDGRSQVISRTVWDAVEWLKPQLADVFTSGEEIVQFSPRSADDVEAAEQETDYVNHIITQRNNWFDIFYSWAHDALIQKDGYVKAYWDDTKDVAVERYEMLSPDEFALLSQDKDIDIVEQATAITIDEMGMESITYSAKIERKKPRNVVKIKNIAPENVRVDQNARSICLQDESVSFVQHVEYQTISQLREAGFDVDDDINDSGDGFGDWQEDARDKYTPFRDRDDGNAADPSMRRVKVRETWIRADVNYDGYAELRHVIVVGTTILLNEECDVVPIVAMCPIPLPHRHYGLSVADAVMDLQRIQTALLRGSLDNQYLANNGRYGISDDVNLDDMLDSRPGGVVRVMNGQSPSAAIMPLTHPTAGANVIPMMEYVDRLGQKRTGVNEQTQGLDPNALNKTATGAQIMMTASQQRIKFIARIFGESVKQLFQLVHQLTLTHSRQQEIVRMRGKWVPVDPRQWVKRTDLTINTNYGTGDKAQQIAMMTNVLAIQKEAIAAGLATPQNIYNTLVRLTRAAGYKDADEFWQDPAKAPPKPPAPPDTAIVIEEMRQKMDVQKFAADQQVQQMRLDNDKERYRLQLELQATNDARDSEREQLKAQLQAELEQYKAEANRSIEEAKLATEKEIELLRQTAENDRVQFKTTQDNETRILIERMKLGDMSALFGQNVEQELQPDQSSYDIDSGNGLFKDQD